MRGSTEPSHSTSGQAQARASRRLPGVEGLRAVAAVSILVYHAWIYGSPDGLPTILGPLSRFVLPHLGAGVLLFFALSGYLLYRPLASAIVQAAPLPSPRNYFRNRALRIFPAYWTVLVVTGLVLPAGLVWSSSTTLELGRLIDHPQSLLNDLLLVQNYFRGSMDTGIGPAWTLAVEMHFYLILPVFGLLAARLSRRLKTAKGRACAALVPAALLAWIGLIGAWVEPLTRAWPDTYWNSVLVRGFFYHADLFTFGIVVAVAHVALQEGLWRPSRAWRWGAWSGLIACTGLAVWLTDRGTVGFYQGAVEYETLVSIACALLVALVVLPVAQSERPSTLLRALETRPVVFVGLVSYSLFLWHEPLIRSLQAHGLTLGGTSGFFTSLVLFLVVSLAAASLTYRYVEKPFLRKKRVISILPLAPGHE